jgi:hypothetical protein
VIGGNRRDPKIDWFLFDFYLDATVLWQAFFCDAHRTGHDLEPADDCGLQTFWGRLHLLQNAVDPKSDPKFFVQRF